MRVVMLSLLLAGCVTPGPFVCPSPPEPPAALLVVPAPLPPVPADLPARRME